MKEKIFFNGMVFLLGKMSLVLATSLGSPIPYDDRVVIFKPGLEVSFPFTVGQGIHVEAYIRTDKELEPYIKLIDPKPLEGDRTVTVQIKLGNSLSPGEHRITVGAKETVGEAGGVGAVTGVETAIRVISLSSEKVITGYLDVRDVNEGQNASLSAVVRSWSYQDIESIYADVEVFNAQEEGVGKFRTHEISLKSGQIGSVSAQMETSGLKPGWYNAMATIYYDGSSIQGGDDFRIGTLRVDIVGHTKELKPDRLNKFEINVQSNWNQPLENVYGEVEWGSNKEKTPTIQIPRFGEAILTTYLDTSGMEVGEKPVKMTVYYLGEQMERISTVMVKKEEGIEKPGEIARPVNPIYILLILLIILNLVFFGYQRRRRKELVPQAPLKSNNGKLS